MLPSPTPRAILAQQLYGRLLQRRLSERPERIGNAALLGG
jgi:hypothetical protein